MKDTIDRRSALGALAGVLALATPVDPISTATDRDRISYVA